MPSPLRWTLLGASVAILATCGSGSDVCPNGGPLQAFADLDGDGYGARSPQRVCVLGPQQVTRGGDCDDSDPSVHPGAEEPCDLVDNNCDGVLDDGQPKEAFYPDRDGDGFGLTEGEQQYCKWPGKPWIQIPGDCDDRRADRSPTAHERCNGQDDDCDGLTDDDDDTLDLATRDAWYADADGDGYGNAQILELACAAPRGFVDNPDDCDDTRKDVSPGEILDLCDLIDNDCDGLIDDEDMSVDVGEQRWFPCDRDADTYGDAYEDCLACWPTPGYAAENALDCDDSDALANVTQDWLEDVDEDGAGVGEPVVTQCLNPNVHNVPRPAVPLGPRNRGIDCAPKDADIHPGAVEMCEDGVDQNCTGRDCASCREWHVHDPTLPDGVYAMDVGTGTDAPLYCDMTTDGGGWTLVSSTFGQPVNDAAQGYHDDLATLFPTSAQDGVFDGLRALADSRDDLRFACKIDRSASAFDVDLSFYSVDWYRRITTGTDADSDFLCCNGASAPSPPPSRRDNVGNVILARGNEWDFGYCEGEDYVADTGDFTIDFDDRCAGANPVDGTDWGEDDGITKCGTRINPQNGVWFVFFRER